MSQAKISLVAFENELITMLLKAPATWTTKEQFRAELLAIYNRQLAQLGHFAKVNPTLATWV